MIEQISRMAITKYAMENRLLAHRHLTAMLNLISGKRKHPPI